MEPTALDIQRTGDLGGTKVKMKFDENSIAHIMSVLTDLYSDPAMAVIREYSTNAWDSHIAAGQTRPIEVTTPGQFAPFFKVKDYGLGLSVDDISNIYSQYGASTKRGTNEQVGMLGLGCKSALTFAPQFTLNAIKNGVKATVAISRMEDGTGVMEIVDTCSTDEINGVEVIIPARGTGDFNMKVDKFFSYWTPGSVLVNGKEPKFVEGNKVGDNFLVVKGSNAPDVVVMGNVAYPLKDRNMLYKRDYYANFAVVAYVPIGSINFTPSREALHYTAHTLKTIEAARAEFTAGLADSISLDVDKAPTHAEALTRFISWESMVGKNLPAGVKYKGAEIPKNFPLVQNGFMYHVNRTRYSVDTINKVDYHTLSKSAVITGFKSERLSGDQRSKIRAFAAANNINVGQWIIVETPFGAPWVSNTYDWNDVRKAARKIKKASAGLRFSVYDATATRFKDTDEIDEETTIVYFSPADHKYCNWAAVAPDDSVTLVSISKNRWDKFLRDFPTAVEIKSHLRSMEKDVVADLSESDRLALGLDYYVKNMLTRLDANKIDDPAVVKFIGLAKGADSNTPAIQAWKRMTKILADFAMREAAVAIDSNPLERYPLISGNSVQPHTYLYMNAAYNAEKEI